MEEKENKKWPDVMIHEKVEMKPYEVFKKMMRELYGEEMENKEGGGVTQSLTNNIYF